MKNPKKTILISGVGILFFPCVFLSIALTADYTASNSSFEDKSIKELFQEMGDNKGNQQSVEIRAYLDQKASPKNADDIQLMDSELRSSDPVHQQRGKNWLENAKDPELGKSFLIYTQAYEKQLKELKPSTSNQERSYQLKVFSELLLKLGELNVKEAIPYLRQVAYDNQKDKKSPIAEYAIASLAKLGDESFFGGNKQEQLKNGYFDVNDIGTKVWLKQEMLHGSDKKSKAKASQAFTSVDENGDMPFIGENDRDFVLKEMVLNPSADWNIKVNGIEALGRMAKNKPGKSSVKDNEIRDTLIHLLETTNPQNVYSRDEIVTRSESAKSLRYYTHDPKVIAALEKALTDKHKEIKFEARESLVRLTGKYYHFEGEDYCDLHPRVDRFGTMPPKER